MSRLFDRPARRAARLVPVPAAALLLLLAVACSGISERTLRAMVPDAEDQYARSRLQQLAHGDVAAVARELAPDLQGPASDEQLQEMARVFGGRPIERFQLIGVQVGTADGVTRRNLSYQLRLADGWAVANVQSRTAGGGRVIEGATVKRIPEPLDRTHAFRLSGKPPLSYAMLAAAVLVPLLMLYAALLAFRMPVRHRWLWVLLSVVGFGRWDLNWTTGETGFMPVNLQLLGSGIVRPSPFAPWIISIALPAGALWVVWRYHRGRWRTAPEPPAAGPETVVDEGHARGNARLTGDAGRRRAPFGTAAGALPCMDALATFGGRFHSWGRGSMKIVSGGQTGVDRAALDVALELGMECGGWCPAGRWAEDGPIDARYPLRETPSADPAQRTEWNVRDSDATLLLTSGAESGGTALTREAARRLGKPVYTFHAGALEDVGAFRRWLQVAKVRTLNVAGPRESEAPGIHADARRILLALLGRGNEFASVEALHPE